AWGLWVLVSWALEVSTRRQQALDVFHDGIDAGVVIDEQTRPPLCVQAEDRDGVRHEVTGGGLVTSLLEVRAELRGDLRDVVHAARETSCVNAEVAQVL